jgi:hypothetical protein
VGVCDDGDKAGGAADGAAGAADGGYGQLERRVEAISGEFNSQEVGNTLWAIQFNISRRFCCSLSCRLPSIVLDDHKIFRQLHQFSISYDMIEGLHVDLSVSVQTLEDKFGPSCQAAFIWASVHPSASQ